MGIQTKGSQNIAQEAHLQPYQMSGQGSWCNLTLEEARSDFGGSGEPQGSMNLEQLIKNGWTSGSNRFVGMERRADASPSSSLAHCQSNSSLARAMSAKTVDELWKEIRVGKEKTSQTGYQKLGEMILEDFLVQAGLNNETSRSPSVGLDLSADEGSLEDYKLKIGLSPVPSIGSLSDFTSITSRRNRGDPEAFERAVERRMKRKIKNRESAARSRARKQAYQNELVTKVSHLEEENIRLKKEKEFDAKFSCVASAEPKYQLRRTSSTSI